MLKRSARRWLSGRSLPSAFDLTPSDFADLILSRKQTSATAKRMTEYALNSLGFAKSPADTRVVVAMSGGVDSSVVAALLHAQGYDVIGITLQLYDHGQAVGKVGACCAGADIHDARRVADRLGIPHYVLDYESRFRTSVMESFADSYLKGETPIPCVLCNQEVKFADLLQTARDLGADCLATGHYVQRKEVNGKAELHAAVDQSRDQSYFLFATTQDQLDYLRFPLGGMAKTQVRALAEQFELAVATKPDSQDICFVPNGRYVDVVQKLRPGALEPGEIVHLDGRVLGSHKGIINFTVGQRKGLEIGGLEEPLYVVKVEAATRRVIVGPREALLTASLALRDVSWIGDGSLKAPQKVMVKVRSSSSKVSALLVPGSPVQIMFEKPEGGVSPGQACVFYDDMRVLGGGWITATTPAYQAPAIAETAHKKAVFQSPQPQ